jgi:hypothetical protein
MAVKKLIAVLSASVLLAFGWLIHSQITQSKRESAYRTSLAAYQRDLHVGMKRNDVQNYLDERKALYHWASFGGSAETYLVWIAEEPGGIVCKPWKVYVALEFTPTDALQHGHAGTEVDPSDKLSGLRVKKLGVCL